MKKGFGRRNDNLMRWITGATESGQLFGPVHQHFVPTKSPFQCARIMNTEITTCAVIFSGVYTRDAHVLKITNRMVGFQSWDHLEHKRSTDGEYCFLIGNCADS